MRHTFDGLEFEILLCSDVVGDGMFLEASDSEGRVRMIAYYYDKTGRFTFSMGTDSQWAEELPFELVETFVARARQQLPSTEQD